MIDTLAAIDYLRPRRSDFWRWDEREQSVEWKDGRTIAFGQELERVLARFEKRGLPSLDIVLLVYAALRDSWNSLRSKSDSLVDYLVDCGLASNRWNEMIAQLDRLHELTLPYRSNVETRTTIVEMLLESLPTKLTSQEAIRWTLDFLSSRSTEYLHQLGVEQTSISRIGNSGDLHALIQALASFSPEKLRMRLLTGVDEPPVPPPELKEESFSASLEARELIETLSDDDQWWELGQCARQVLAALYRPADLRPSLSLYSEGWSDITNRGQLDRLMLSELAYDDELLSIRILNGESLYIRREVPPEKSPQDRMIFIESGIGTWGITRWYCAATAIALTAAADKDSKVVVWRNTGDNQLAESHFTDESGLQQHLADLHAVFHPGETLSALAQKWGDTQGEWDLFYIISKTAWSSDEFQRELATHGPKQMTIAIIDRWGQLELLRWSRRGSVLIKSLQLSIEQSEPARKLLSADRLPAIFDQRPFPLRLPLSSYSSLPVNKGLLIAVCNRSLFIFDNEYWGAIPLTNRLPAGMLAWAGETEDHREVWAVWRHNEPARFTLFRFDRHTGKELASVPFTLDAARCDYDIQSDVLIVAVPLAQSGGTLTAIDPVRGSVLATQKLEQFYHHTITKEDGIWRDYVFNGICFESRKISFADQVDQTDAGSSLFFVCRTPTRTGYLGVARDRVLITQSDSPADGSVSVQRVSDILSNKILGDHRWLWVTTANGQALFEIQGDGRLEQLSILLGDRNLHQKMCWGVSKRIHSRGFRNRFQSVGLVQGALTLSRAGQFYSLVLRQDILVWSENHDRSQLTSAAKFHSRRDMDKTSGLKLDFAERNGIQIILDSRGLLHLRSLSKPMLELTLVLSDGLACGWVADGRWFGLAYYAGKNPLMSHQRVNQDILKPLLEAWT